MQNLDLNQPIVDENGRPTQYFMRLLQERGDSQEDVSTLITALQADILGKANKSIILTAGTGLGGGGDLSADRTFNLEDTAVTPATYGSATKAPVITVDQQGRITAASEVAISGGGGGGGGGFAAVAASPWWRILYIVGTDDYSNYGYIGFSEIQFQDNAGAVLSTGGTAYASRQLDGNWPPSEAFDGIANANDNGWFPTTAASTLPYVDFIAYKTPADITPYQLVVWPPFNHVNGFPTRFAVQYSLTGGADWLTVKVCETVAPAANVGQTFVL